MNVTDSCIQHERRLSIWNLKGICLLIGCLRWMRELNIGDLNIGNYKDAVILGLVVTKRNCPSCRRNIQNVLLALLFFTVNGISNVISEYCCEAHIWSPIEDRRECLYYMELFIAFVNNKIIEEYFSLFQFWG